jgi:hypothetical protein
MQTYTIAVVYDHAFFACVPDGGDIEEAMMEVEATYDLDINRETVSIVKGVHLVNELQRGDSVVWDSKDDYINDDYGNPYQYAVRRYS